MHNYHNRILSIIFYSLLFLYSIEKIDKVMYNVIYFSTKLKCKFNKMKKSIICLVLRF